MKWFSNSAYPFRFLCNKIHGIHVFPGAVWYQVGTILDSQQYLCETTIFSCVAPSTKKINWGLY